MVHTVPYAFDAFYEAINLPGDHRTAANARKDWIVQRLGQSLDVLDAFAIGSIPRYTALRGHADLDVLVVLHYGQHIRNRTPSEVLATVKNALGSGAGNYRRNGQAVTISFRSWPNVDVVPASRVTNGDGAVSYYKIPDMNRGVWITTKPRRHARNMAHAAEQEGPGFRQAITMLKHWNRRQSVRLQSYHLEVIALGMTCDWNDPGWAILKWFEEAKERMSFCWDGSEDISDYLSWEQGRAAKQRLQECHDLALSAWALTYRKNEHREALGKWRALFGREFPAYG